MSEDCAFLPWPNACFDRRLSLREDNGRRRGTTGWSNLNRIARALWPLWRRRTSRGWRQHTSDNFGCTRSGTEMCSSAFSSRSEIHLVLIRSAHCKEQQKAETVICGCVGNARRGCYRSDRARESPAAPVGGIRREHQPERRLGVSGAVRPSRPAEDRSCAAGNSRQR